MTYGPAQKAKRFDGKMSPDRESWVRFGRLELVLYVSQDEDEPGEDVRMIIDDSAGKRKPVMLSLSDMTEQEIIVLRQFLNRALDKAAPAAAERDRIAQEAFEAGDDSYARMYRPVPQFVVRERKVRSDDDGVRE